MKLKRSFAALLAVVLLLSAWSGVLAADNSALTLGQVADLLLVAADGYNDGLTREALLQGDGGSPRESEPATRLDAVIMLSRAFGELPELAGDSLRMAPPAQTFADVPDWAQETVSALCARGITTGTAPGQFSPDRVVTADQLDLMIRRVWALEASDLKDDFFAALNREWLATAGLEPGMPSNGTFEAITKTNNDRIAAIIKELSAGSYQKGTPEQKISDFYRTILDKEAREQAGITPIAPYLEELDRAQTIQDLLDVQSKTVRELGLPLSMSFSLTIDLKDSDRYMLGFTCGAPSLTKDLYAAPIGAQQQAYLDYIAGLLALSGESQEDAARHARLYYDFEKDIAAHMLSPQESSDVDKIYNLRTMAELQAMFPAVNLEQVLADSGLKSSDRIIVSDPGLLQAIAGYWTQEHLDVLKVISKLGLVSSSADLLTKEFADLGQTFQEQFLGVQGAQTDEEQAAAVVQSLMSDYLGELYAERYFSPEAKEDVTNMVKDFIAVYRTRIQSLDWMSDATKQMALKKLDTMSFKIGYPDQWDSDMDEVEIKGPGEGGTYFDNVTAIRKASRSRTVSVQDQPVDKSQWGFPVYMVNAFYNATSNEIIFPAGILQAPFYDVNASREANLGGIGFVIAHEITHSFDNNGAKFDENGNAADWWAPEDYAKFQELCQKAITYYDGPEIAPGIRNNGVLTLSENIADLGAMACITQCAEALENPNFKAMYENLAKCWQMTASREYTQYLGSLDVHSFNKIRANRVLSNYERFYSTYNILPGDGMYISPDLRVHIW